MILEKYQQLLNSTHLFRDGFMSLSLDDESIFRLAIDNELNPTILISEKKFKSRGWTKTNFRLDKLQLSFNVTCDIRDINSGIELNAPFTIIKQVNGNSRMHEYFLRVCDGIITELRRDLSSDKLNKEIEYLVKLFSSPKKSDEKSIQGLWGELLYILNSEDIEKVITAWYIDRDNLFDFSFEDHSVEVKTTIKNSRTHTFNNSQLIKYKKLNVQVVSIITERVSLGKSVLDLWDEINARPISTGSYSKVSRIISETLVQDLDGLDRYKYNYNLAVSTLRKIPSGEIPNIETENIPSGIIEVHIQINLDAI
jgi:hypothetical protein